VSGGIPIISRNSFVVLAERVLGKRAPYVQRGRIQDVRSLSRRRGEPSTRDVVLYWYPAEGHPDGPSKTAWFRVVDGWGYKAAGHPAGRSRRPCFRVMGQCAQPTLSLPGDAPTFRIIGGYAVTEAGVAWFSIVEEPAES
jgi:hypothetical protein